MFINYLMVIRRNPIQNTYIVFSTSNKIKDRNLTEEIHREISAELENLKTGLKVVKLRFDVKSH